MAVLEWAIGALGSQLLEQVIPWLRDNQSRIARFTEQFLEGLFIGLIGVCIIFGAWLIQLSSVMAVDVNEVRGLYQDAVQAILEISGVLVAGSLAAFAFLVANPREQSNPRSIRRVRAFGGQLRAVIFYGILVFLIGIYLLVTQDLNSPSKKMLIATLALLFGIHLAMTALFVNRCIGMAR